MEFKLISKSIYFPEKKILAIGDLHLGYEEMLKDQGIMVPINQLEQTKKEIKQIIEKIKAQGNEIEKIVLLGDIKHHFSFQKGEKFEVRKFLVFLKKFVKEKNIILIKGNHDKIELDKRSYHKFYIEEDLAFTHGDKWYKSLEDKKIKTIVMGHIHPATLIKDPEGIKREKYKCFLIGKFKRKKIIIVPSFFAAMEGVNFDAIGGKNKFEQMIHHSKLKNFETFIVGKNRIYEFGKLKDL